MSTFGKCRGLEKNCERGILKCFLGDWKISFTLIIAHSQYKPISYLKQKKLPV